jgi:hypothetical protein
MLAIALLLTQNKYQKKAHIIYRLIIEIIIDFKNFIFYYLKFLINNQHIFIFNSYLILFYLKFNI